MEHLTNCHGEWLYLAQILGALPFVGFWIRSRFMAHTHHGSDEH